MTRIQYTGSNYDELKSLLHRRRDGKEDALQCGEFQ